MSTSDEVDVSLDQTFDLDGLVALRSAVAAHADRLGLPLDRVQELVLVAHELASNAIRHGAGTGRLRIWAGDGMVHCEISDPGPGFANPGDKSYWQPPVDQLGGRGLWLAYHLCDDFDLVSGPDGTTATASFGLPA
jgi:anti-sigma regulatory factor (Ser/Thr protein kinase)